jgi:hypothetical protein
VGLSCTICIFSMVFCMSLYVLASISFWSIWYCEIVPTVWYLGIIPTVWNWTDNLVWWNFPTV